MLAMELVEDGRCDGSENKKSKPSNSKERGTNWNRKKREVKESCYYSI
jgi:hypothetical protein